MSAPQIGRGLRYTRATIATALATWGLWGRSAEAVRAELSPWPVRGATEASRWRSLDRWTRKADQIFDIEIADTSGLRERARRAAGIVMARGPSDATQAERVFVGAHVC